MKIYHYYHDSKEFYRSEDYEQVNGIGIPRFSTELPPLEVKENFTSVFDDKKLEWVYVEDYRNKKAYHKETCEEFLVTRLGPLHEMLTLDKPNSHLEIYVDGKWVHSPEKEKAYEAVAKEESLDDLKDRLEREMGLIHELIKVGEVSKAELKHLKAINKFIPIVSRCLIIGKTIPEAPVYPKVLDKGPIWQRIKAFFGV